eukprot:1215913-Amphidinium_carterae.1
MFSEKDCFALCIPKWFHGSCGNLALVETREGSLLVFCQGHMLKQHTLEGRYDVSLRSSLGRPQP